MGRDNDIHDDPFYNARHYFKLISSGGRHQAKYKKKGKKVQQIFRLRSVTCVGVCVCL